MEFETFTNCRFVQPTDPMELGEDKGLGHEQSWSLRSSRVRVMPYEHLTTTYQAEVTSPAVLQVAGITWPLPCLPWKVGQIDSNYFHQQFKVTYPILPEGEEGIP